jgi:hypothetical protein
MEITKHLYTEQFTQSLTKEKHCRHTVAIQERVTAVL